MVQVERKQLYHFLFWSVFLIDLVVLGLTALLDSISVYIGPSPKEREKDERNNRREKKCPNNPPPPPPPTASAEGPCPTFYLNK